MRPLRQNRRAVVLVMVLGIIAAMTAVATAFVMFMNQAYKAAANTRYTAQAELACRSGLEHAIRAIRESLNLYVCETHAVDAAGTVYDDLATDGAKVGWCRYFEGGMPMVRYATDHIVTGRLFQVGAPLVQMEYAIRVYDLDGGLHPNLPLWTDGQATGTSDLQDVVSDLGKQAGLDDTEADDLADESDDLAFSSLSEMARRAGVTDTADKYALEEFFTVYPLKEDDSTTITLTAVPPTYNAASNTSTLSVGGGGLTPGALAGKAARFDDSGNCYTIAGNEVDAVTVKGDCSAETGSDFTAVVLRPRVNINTIPESLLIELLDQIPTIKSIGNLSDALAKYMIDRKPFLGRHDFEEAIRRAAGDDGIIDLHDYNAGVPNYSATISEARLHEDEFNDLLNSFAGALGSDGGAFDEDDSAYDDPVNPGEYSFDGWEDAAEANWEGPGQTGGQRSKADGDPANPGDPVDNVTWSTEIRFTSRFFHVYVLGRGWNPKSNRPRGIRRLHAIYDAEVRRIVWLRWNLSNRGSVSDILP